MHQIQNRLSRGQSRRINNWHECHEHTIVGSNAITNALPGRAVPSNKIENNQVNYQKTLDEVHFMLNWLNPMDSVTGKRKLTIIYKENSYD